ncbi:hypothetical protein BVRB_2g036560 [Beta vulgaris subsp. vulgaris]|nr:hypothetical protein BVRB_2g036560 [Beta vulgaris subsp. vulgaris]
MAIVSTSSEQTQPNDEPPKLTYREQRRLDQDELRQKFPDCKRRGPTRGMKYYTKRPRNSEEKVMVSFMDEVRRVIGEKADEFLCDCSKWVKEFCPLNTKHKNKDGTTCWEPIAEKHYEELKKLHETQIQEHGEDNLNVKDAYIKALKCTSGYVRGIGPGARPPKKGRTGENNERLSTQVDTLAASNEELKASNEQLKASNEQLKASNEEFKASNEELRAEFSKLNKEAIEREKKMREDMLKMFEDMRQYTKYEPVAEQYAVSAWRPLNRLPLFPKVAELVVPTATLCSKKYKQTVKIGNDKGYRVAKYMPLVPIDKIVKVCDAQEGDTKSVAVNGNGTAMPVAAH